MPWMSRYVASAPSRSALLTTKMSAISRMPAFTAWIASPMPGREQHQRGVGEAGDLDLGLADADGLHEHQVAARAVEHPHRLRGRRRQPAEVAPAGHRADVDAGVGGVVLHADPVAEDRPAGERAGRVDGEHADPAARFPERADQLVGRWSTCPRPGAPVSPMTCGRPRRTARAPPRPRQHAVAVLDQGDQARDGAGVTRRGPRVDQPRADVAACRRRVMPARSVFMHRSRSASPWPPPPHSAAAPRPPPRRRSSSARVRASRAPDMPIGWPSAIAPPLTLTIAGSMPRSRGGLDAHRGERLVDLDQVEVGRGQPRLAQRCLIALDGWLVQRVVGAGDVAVRADLGEPGQPELLGLGLAHDDDRGGAVGDRRGGSGGDGAVLAERGPQLGQRSRPWCPGRMPSSSVTSTGSPLRCGISTGDDLLGEARRPSARRRPSGGWRRRTRPAPRG